MKVPEKHDKIPEGEGLDVPRLLADLGARGISAEGGASVDGLVTQVAQQAREGDVVLVMSNGGFGGFIEKLLLGLRS